MPSQAALNAAMLTVADMPAGFTKEASSESSSESSSPGASTTNTECSKNFGNVGSGESETDLISGEQGAVEAEVGFEGDLGEFIAQHAAVYTATKTAQTLIGTLRAAAAKCTTPWTEHDEEGKSTYTLSELSFPKAGDDTLALQEKVTSEAALGLTLVINIVYVQSKNALVLVAKTGIESVDTATLTKLVPIAVSRVDKAVASA